MSVDARLLQDDIDARDDALDVARSFIVQAPAGSGKTELLIQRYLCLLAIVDNPEEVLAITFTRKAAQEMRNRVLAALRNARDGVVAETRHEQKTLSLAGLVLKQDAENQWQLIQLHQQTHNHHNNDDLDSLLHICLSLQILALPLPLLLSLIHI